MDDTQSAPAGEGRYAAVLPLVRMLARQAAREDYARALEAAGAKPYSTKEVRGAPEVAEES